MLSLPRLACSRIGDTSPAKIAMPVDASPRAASPRVMCSTLMTSAPQSLRMADAAGTKVWSARSRMRMPSMGRCVLMRWFLRDSDAVQIPCRIRLAVIRSVGPVRTPGMQERTGGLPRADIGVFGGSGFYAFLPDAVEVAVMTGWGAPSAPVMVATVGGLRVAFLPRHGRHHELPAHRV